MRLAPEAHLAGAWHCCRSVHFQQQTHLPRPTTMASKALPTSIRGWNASRKAIQPQLRSMTSACASRQQRAALPLLSTSRRGPHTLLQPPLPLPSRASIRLAHSIPRPPSSQRQQSTESPQQQQQQQPNTPRQPSYELTFTCVPCGTRSAHNVSKQGYHHGSVLITCPSCRNRHIISDHLHIFGNRNVTVEELVRERGQLVKRGTLGEDGDVEFWEDGTTTVRDERQGEGEGMDPRPAPRADPGQQGADGEAPGSSFGKA